MRVLRALYERFELLIHELAKFGVIGGIGFCLDFGLFNVLHHGGRIGPLTANFISSLTAAAFTYLGNRYWSFRHMPKQPFRKEIPPFFVLNLFGVIITEAFIAFVYYALGFHSPAGTNAGKLIGTAVATLFRFYTYKRFVFNGGATDQRADDILEGEAVFQV